VNRGQVCLWFRFAVTRDARERQCLKVGGQRASRPDLRGLGGTVADQPPQRAGPTELDQRRNRPRPMMQFAGHLQAQFYCSTDGSLHWGTTQAVGQPQDSLSQIPELPSGALVERVADHVGQRLGIHAKRLCHPMGDQVALFSAPAGDHCVEKVEYDCPRVRLGSHSWIETSRASPRDGTGRVLELDGALVAHLKKAFSLGKTHGHAEGASGFTKGRVADLDDHLVGRAGFGPLRDGRELGHTIRRDLWGRGLASEVGAALITWHQTHVAHIPLYAYVAVAHPGSRRVVQKLGFEPIGREDHCEVSRDLFHLPAGS